MTHFKPFSTEITNELLSKGYKYLVLDENSINEEQRIVFQAVKKNLEPFSVPLNEMMDFSKDTDKKLCNV